MYTKAIGPCVAILTPHFNKFNSDDWYFFWNRLMIRLSREFNKNFTKRKTIKNWSFQELINDFEFENKPAPYINSK